MRIATNELGMAKILWAYELGSGTADLMRTAPCEAYQGQNFTHTFGLFLSENECLGMCESLTKI